MIKIKSATQIEQMKKAGALSKMALRHVGAMVRPGVSTFELDQLAEQIIRMHGGTPAFKRKMDRQQAFSLLMHNKNHGQNISSLRQTYL